MQLGRYTPRMCNGFTLVFRAMLPMGHFEYIRYDLRKPEVRGFLHRARKSGRKRNNQIINRAGKNLRNATYSRSADAIICRIKAMAWV